MTATPYRQPYVVKPDNGYFQVWERNCGHTVRVTTEDTQWDRKRIRGEAKRLDALTQERLAETPCRRCQEAVLVAPVGLSEEAHRDARRAWYGQG
ncbi:MAG: hypothetical protein EHM65_07620 [Acidobacteriales bacterium]|nr:MAG: hypothetical protein EHM65_07620 [Terriglobales bacterium]